MGGLDCILGSISFFPPFNDGWKLITSVTDPEQAKPSMITMEYNMHNRFFLM